MSRFKKIAITTFLVLFIVGVISPLVYVQVNKKIYETRVTNYLIKDMGYTREEIKTVEGVWGFKLPQFYTIVVFENEPYVEYTYFAHNKVLQFEYRITEEGKQKGITKEDLKNHDPAWGTF